MHAGVLGRTARCSVRYVISRSHQQLRPVVTGFLLEERFWLAEATFFSQREHLESWFQGLSSELLQVGSELKD